MRLFVSYARIDKPFCIQVVNTLNIHEIWYDQRLYAGQQWWNEILRRLDWCEGFVYLLSPDSVDSEYCRKEFRIARGLGRHVFPVLIDEKTPIPAELKHVQYVDMSNGLTLEGVTAMLNSIHIAEREGQPQPTAAAAAISSAEIKAPTVNPTTVIGEAAGALEAGQYDKAVFLLKQAREQGYTSRFIDISALMNEAEVALDREARLREMEREYKQIVELVTRARTSNLGCEAFRAFRNDFPDYDPDNLATLCGDESVVTVAQPPEAPAPEKLPVLPPTPSITLPLLEWVKIPAGMVTAKDPGKNGDGKTYTYHVDAFHLSRYPVTNAQYQMFLDDSEGYAETAWWDYSPQALNWRQGNPESKPPRFQGDERPRDSVTWYEAVAYCRWMSYKTGLEVVLPSGLQWQRAAQGDSNNLYPWGNEFDPSRCNTKESRLRMTTFVMRYDGGASPFGVYDMAGNVWEWCINADYNKDEAYNIAVDADRAIHGGSFIGDQQRARTTFHYYLNPTCFYSNIGFRLASTSPLDEMGLT